LSNLYAAEAHLSFDKERLQVVDPASGQPANHIQPGALLTPSDAAGLVKNQADNSAGTIDYAVTLTHPDVPVPGSGTLATISFKAVAQGTATVLYKNPVSVEPPVKLADADGKAISVSIQAAPVNISVSNSPPAVANVTASQASGTGTVNITYDLSDQTESSATVSFKFWNGTQWPDCQSAIGEGSTSMGTGKSGTWNAKLDFDNQYSPVKIKVVADDGQSANNIGEGEGSAFTLDTKAPTNVGCSSPQNNAVNVLINTEVAALAAADDSSPITYQFRLAEDQAFTSEVQESAWLTGNAWSPGNLGYSETYWWAVQAKDAYGNYSGWSIAFSFTTVAEGGVLAQETISPTSETTVATADGSITIVLPAGAVTTQAELIIREQSCEDTPAPPSGFKAVGNCFSIEMTQALLPDVMVTIVVKYSDADVEVAGGDPNLLRLAYYDEEGEDWVVLDTTVDIANKTLTAQTDHFSIWTILAKTKGGGLPAWVWVVIGLGAVVVVVGASGLWFRSRRLATAPSVQPGSSDQSRGGN
jgi:hypothetical protein